MYARGDHGERQSASRRSNVRHVGEESVVKTRLPIQVQSDLNEVSCLDRHQIVVREYANNAVRWVPSLI